MDAKTILREFFVKYGELGARSVSLRGCYEMPVPNAFIKKSKAKELSKKTENTK